MEGKISTPISAQPMATRNAAKLIQEMKKVGLKYQKTECLIVMRERKVGTHYFNLRGGSLSIVQANLSICTNIRVDLKNYRVTFVVWVRDCFSKFNKRKFKGFHT